MPDCVILASTVTDEQHPTDSHRDGFVLQLRCDDSACVTWLTFSDLGVANSVLYQHISEVIDRRHNKESKVRVYGAYGRHTPDVEFEVFAVGHFSEDKWVIDPRKVKTDLMVTFSWLDALFNKMPDNEATTCAVESIQDEVSLHLRQEPEGHWTLLLKGNQKKLIALGMIPEKGVGNRQDYMTAQVDNILDNNRNQIAAALSSRF